MLHWLYPRVCELCHRPGAEELCPTCIAALPRVPLPICLYCGAPVSGELEDPYRCRECQARPRSFDFARSALVSSPQTLHLVYRLKYHHANYLAPVLGGLLQALWEDTPALAAQENWCLVPVPAGIDHLFERGYNQAEELARALGKRLGLPIFTPLERRRTGVDSQTRLSASDRWRNALASYAALEPYAQGHLRLHSHVALIDDVYTTGATTRACARALKALPGVKKVAVLTLLRATSR